MVMPNRDVYRPRSRRHCSKARRAPDAALFVGSGKADEIKELATMHGAKEILFDQSLSPAQQRNLERHLGMAVNDRTLLILEIFAQRARSHEGKLQVELARLQYLSTRLVRRWTHLERQTGGIGLRGGPGETQIELDRRMLGESIKRIKERLTKVKKQRNTQRRQRERKLLSYYPESGPLRREAYPKHMAFFAAGPRYRERLMMAANRSGNSTSIPNVSFTTSPNFEGWAVSRMMPLEPACRLCIYCQA